MLIESVIGTRMVINFKEHCSRRRSLEPIMAAGGIGSIRFAGARGVSGDTAPLDTIQRTLKDDEDMLPFNGDDEIAEIIVSEEQ